MYCDASVQSLFFSGLTRYLEAMNDALLEFATERVHVQNRLTSPRKFM